MASLQGKEIVIIDDMPDIRLFVRKILENDGAVVNEVDSVDRGLALIRARSPHLVITDLEMPGKTGFDLLAVRKLEEKLREIPTIVLSGHHDRRSVTEAVALGATDYILKPIRATLLLQKVRKQLRARSFLSRRFDADAYPAAQAAFAVDILKAGETGLQIEAPVKLAGDETVRISGELLDAIGAEQALTRTAADPAPYLMKGRYVSEIGFVGAGDALARHIREKLKALKAMKGAGNG